MIVESIKVSYWRNIVRDLLAVGPFSENLNVVYAPNGSGKSSVFEALRRGLMDRHNITGEDINQIRPWGKGLAPKVIVEFKHNGNSFRITKQFIHAPMSLLEKKRGGVYEADANGREADEKLKELLAINPPAKGLSKAEHWGWAQALWAPQGSLAIGTLSNDVVSDIREILGAHLAAGGSSEVEKEINRRYDKYFTGNKGNLKKGKDAPPSVGFKEKLKKAEQDFLDAKQSHEDFQRTSADVEAFRAQSAKCYQDRERIKALLASTENEVKKYIGLKNDKTRNEKDAEIHGSRHRELNGLIQGIETDEKTLANELEQIGSVKEEVKTKKEELATAEEHFKTCKEAVDNTKTIEAEVGKMNAVAEDARSFVDISSRLSDLWEKLSNISAAGESLRGYESQKETIKAPDSKTLKAISKAITDRETINVKIEASLMNVEVMAETGLTLDVMKGDTPGPFRIDQGSTNVFKGSPEVSLRIPEVATIRAWGPTGSVEELRRELDKIEKNILKLTEPYGTAELATLEDLCAKVGKIDQDIEAEKLKIKTLLGKEDQVNLEMNRKDLEKTHATILEIHPEWAINQPDTEKLKLEADKAAKSLEKQKDETSRKLDEARDNVNDLEKNIRVLEAKIEGMEKTIKQIEDRLNTLKKDNRTPEQRKKELGEISISWDAAKTKLEDVENRLKYFHDDPEKVAEKFRSEKESLEDQYSECKEKENVAIGSLRELSNSGSYSLLAEVNERISQLKMELERAELEQESIKLLHDTVDAVRKEALASVSKPVEDEATEILNFICGADLGRICLGGSFEPAEITPDSCDFNVGLANLSGGEREQLYFSVRLALADVLAQQERQLVVLDDVLTATDSARLARVLNVLEERAKKLQIIVLTCQPERYQPLVSAKFFDLCAA